MLTESDCPRVGISRAVFADWLRSLPPDESAGVPGSQSDDPHARFLRAHGYTEAVVMTVYWWEDERGSRGHALPDWAQRSIEDLDELYEGCASVTAAEMLAIVNGLELPQKVVA